MKWFDLQKLRDEVVAAQVRGEELSVDPDRLQDLLDHLEEWKQRVRDLEQELLEQDDWH